MIVAEQKSIEEISNMISQYEKVLIVGCSTCVAICHSGGEKEVGILASALRMKAKTDGRNITIDEAIVERQCEKEFIDTLEDSIDKYDAVLSLGCGVGVQVIAGKFTDAIVLPGLNTTFMGMPEEQGIWAEYCRGCGNCLLHLTDGICPITRCSKNVLNGPCGGTTADGKCEVDPDIDCAWYLICERLKERGQLEQLNIIQPPKDWRSSGHGGPRKYIRDDLIIDTEIEGAAEVSGEVKE